MKSEKHSASNPAPSPPTKSNTSSISRTLTLSEREELTRRANENDDYAKKAFSHLRPKPKSERGA